MTDPNRPSSDPGGCQCGRCGRIFIGSEAHDVCGVCAEEMMQELADDYAHEMQRHHQEQSYLEEMSRDCFDE